MHGGDRLQHPYMYLMSTQQCQSCSSVPHNVKTSELISMQLTSTTGSGTDSSVGESDKNFVCDSEVLYVCSSKLFHQVHNKTHTLSAIKCI